MSAKYLVPILWLILAGASLVLTFGYLAQHRRPGCSVFRLILAGPLLILRPERYMVDGKENVPMKAVLLWGAGCFLIVSLMNWLF